MFNTLQKTALIFGLLYSVGLLYAAEPIRPAQEDDTFTVLEITFYDQSKQVKVVKTGQLFIEAGQIMSEFPIWREAHRKAERQWSLWYRDKKEKENQGRIWVLPSPVAPQMRKYGPFKFNFEAADKAEELRQGHAKQIEQARNTLWKNANANFQKIVYLDNFLENSKLVRATLSEVREEMIKEENQLLDKMPEAQKKEIWRLGHLAEAQAKKQVAEQTGDHGAKDDMVAIHEKFQALMAPIYAQYKINEWLWCAIWQEGFFNKWPVPGEVGNTDLAAADDAPEKDNQGRNKKKR